MRKRKNQKKKTKPANDWRVWGQEAAAGLHQPYIGQVSIGEGRHGGN